MEGFVVGCALLFLCMLAGRAIERLSKPEDPHDDEPER